MLLFFIVIIVITIISYWATLLAKVRVKSQYVSLSYMYRYAAGGSVSRVT